MLPKIDGSWTLFLDRDGVINERIMGGYVMSTDEFHFLPRVPEAIAHFNQFFGRVVVVTNQQCIGKKLTTERNISNLHAYMLEELRNAKAQLDAIYVAGELKADPDNTRKPKPAMAHKAQAQFPEIDFMKAVMVGDTDSDIHFGTNLGMYTVRIKTEEPIGVEADLTVKSLYEFAELLKNEK